MSAQRAPARRAPQPRHAPELRLVRRRRRSLVTRGASRRAAPVVIGVSIAAAAIVFGVLLEQVVLAQSAFRLADVRERLTTAEARHEELLLEAARLDSSARIERYARQYLGMVDPPPDAVRYIVADVGRTGGKARAPRPPVRTTGGVAAGTSPYGSVDASP